MDESPLLSENELNEIERESLCELLADYSRTFSKDMSFESYLTDVAKFSKEVTALIIHRLVQ